MYSTLALSMSFTLQRIRSYNTRVNQAVFWADFMVPYSTEPSTELSSHFRLTLSCCSTTSSIEKVLFYMYVCYAIKLVGAHIVVIPPLA